MTIKNTYPTVKPTIGANFSRTKKIPTSINYSRLSTGTYVDEDGLIKTAGIGVPRFDYDSLTGECKGLLIEEQRTRINNSYNQTLGSYGLSSGDGELIAPDGTSTGITKMTGLKATTGGIVQRSIDVTYYSGQGLSNFVYCVASCYVYATSEVDSGRKIWIGGVTGFGEIYGSGVLDLQGNLFAYANNFYLRDYTLPRNQWVRIFMQFRKTGTFLQSRLIYNITNNQSNTNFLNTTIGDPVIYFWGLYKEIDSTNNNPRMFPSSFISTNNTTRAADTLTVPAGNLINTEKSSILIQTNSNFNNTPAFSLNDGTVFNESKVLVYPTAGGAKLSTNGNIVTDGLVLNLDAGNPASYPGSAKTQCQRLR